MNKIFFLMIILVSTAGRQSFEFDDNPKTLNNNQWKLSEDSLQGPNNQKLKRLLDYIAYWFAWAGYLGTELNSLMKNRKYQV